MDHNILLIKKIQIALPLIINIIYQGCNNTIFLIIIANDFINYLNSHFIMKILPQSFKDEHN